MQQLLNSLAERPGQALNVPNDVQTANVPRMAIPIILDDPIWSHVPDEQPEGRADTFWWWSGYQVTVGLSEPTGEYLDLDGMIEHRSGRRYRGVQRWVEYRSIPLRTRVAQNRRNGLPEIFQPRRDVGQNAFAERVDTLVDRYIANRMIVEEPDTTPATSVYQTDQSPSIDEQRTETNEVSFRSGSFRIDGPWMVISRQDLAGENQVVIAQLRHEGDQPRQNQILDLTGRPYRIEVRPDGTGDITFMESEYDDEPDGDGEVESPSGQDDDEGSVVDRERHGVLPSDQASQSFRSEWLEEGIDGEFYDPENNIRDLPEDSESEFIDPFSTRAPSSVPASPLVQDGWALRNQEMLEDHMNQENIHEDDREVYFDEVPRVGIVPTYLISEPERLKLLHKALWSLVPITMSSRYHVDGSCTLDAAIFAGVTCLDVWARRNFNPPEVCVRYEQLRDIDLLLSFWIRSQVDKMRYTTVMTSQGMFDYFLGFEELLEDDESPFISRHCLQKMKDFLDLASIECPHLLLRLLCLRKEPQEFFKVAEWLFDLDVEKDLFTSPHPLFNDVASDLRRLNNLFPIGTDPSIDNTIMGGVFGSYFYRNMPFTGETQELFTFN